MSFKLEVEFTGLCMYVIHPDQRQVAVLLPDARWKPPQTAVEASRMTLADGSIGKPHVGYLRYDLADTGAKVPRHEEPQDGSAPLAPKFEVIRRFNCEELDFGLGFDEALFQPPVAVAGGTTQSELRVPEFGRFAPTLKLRPNTFGRNPENLLMRSILRGGRLQSQPQLGDWRLDQTLNPNPAEYIDRFSGAITWSRRVHAEELVLRLSSFDGSEATAIHLRPQGPERIVRLRVANLCSDNPLEWPDLIVRAFDAEFDEDFRWFYNLLDIGDKHIKALTRKRLELPSPQLLTDRMPPNANDNTFGNGGGEADCTGGQLTQEF